MRNPVWAPGLLAVVATAVLPACTAASRYCAAGAECDEEFISVPLDPVGASEDSVNVCVAQQDSFVRSLRANEEEPCQEAAAAWERYMACVAEIFGQDPGDACDPFRVLDNPCDGELDDFGDALQDANGDCSSAEE